MCIFFFPCVVIWYELDVECFLYTFRVGYDLSRVYKTWILLWVCFFFLLAISHVYCTYEYGILECYLMRNAFEQCACVTVQREEFVRTSDATTNEFYHRFGPSCDANFTEIDQTNCFIVYEMSSCI